MERGLYTNNNIKCIAYQISYVAPIYSDSDGRGQGNQN